MQNIKEERVRLQLYKQFEDVVRGLGELDLDPLCDRRFAICTNSVPESETSITSIATSGNGIIDKVTIVFATLVREAELLIAQAKSEFLDCLLLYGEDPGEMLESETGVLKMMANFLSTLHDLALFCTRSCEVVSQLVQQLYAFFTLPKDQLVKASDRPMLKVWRALSDLLAVLVQLDEVIRTHPFLRDHWNVYSKTMQMVRHNPAQFKAVDDKFASLMSVIANVDLHVMSGCLFQNVCMQRFPTEITTDKAFLQSVQKLLAKMLSTWERESTDELPNKSRLIGLFALTLLFQKLGSFDKKHIKNLCNTYKKLPAFHLAGNVTFVPTEFLLQQWPEAEKLLDRKLAANVTAAKQTHLNQLCEALSKEVISHAEAVTGWKLEMKQLKTTTDFQNNTHQFLSSQCMTALKGARIADRISRLVKSVLSGLLAAEKTLLKSQAQHIFTLIELLKSVEATARFYWPTMLEWCLHAGQYWSACILQILDAVRNALGSDTVDLERAAAFMIAGNAMSISPDKVRLTTCAVALEVANYSNSMKAVDAAELDELLGRLEAVTSIGAIYARVVDCGFLFYHRSLARVYFDVAFDDVKLSIENLERFFVALQDGAEMLKSTRHCSVQELRKSYREEVFEAFQELILDRLNTAIENDLRLAVHSRQNLTVHWLEEKLFPTNRKSKQLTSTAPDQTAPIRHKRWLHLKPFNFVGEIVDVKKCVELYLERTFYNLTAVALHDGETYGRMRLLAAHRYGLSLTADKLPYMTIDQGLDVLMIMKNINLFVANYSYDLNEQIFVEKTGKNRSLNVMHVQQVVNSIKTHGVGIVNLAVNYAYQFLKKKFHVFSQFLFDDQIKCQLVKEIRFYRDSIDELNQMYPVKRAERFNSAIAKLGVSPDGKTFLDKFRELITHIGNTIGFIRMIRAGAIESSAYASHFIPKLHDMLDRADGGGLHDPEKEENGARFADIVTHAKASPRSVEIAQTLDSLIDSFAESFSNDSDYVEMLIAVFAKEFRNYDKFSHLRNFFVIVPPLTINYVEHIHSCRSKLGRRAQSDCDFTFVDDGFCLGVAYILTLLNQNYFFDSLNWFDSVFDKFDTEIGRAREEQQAAQQRKDESFSQTLAIKIQRLEELQKEYNFLTYTLHSATMLFKIKNQESNDDEMYLEDF